MIQLAQTDADILRCWPVIYALRPHLIAAEFLDTIKNMMANGYKLAFVATGNEPAAAAIGYRHLQFLFNGPHIYIDDLTTLPEARGQGYGAQLLDFVFEEARAHGYQYVTLDSGPQRHDAHRLYLNKGFQLSAHHFSKKL